MEEHIRAAQGEASRQLADAVQTQANTVKHGITGVFEDGAQDGEPAAREPVLLRWENPHPPLGMSSRKRSATGSPPASPQSLVYTKHACSSTADASTPKNNHGEVVSMTETGGC